MLKWKSDIAICNRLMRVYNLVVVIVSFIDYFTFDHQAFLQK